MRRRERLHGSPDLCIHLHAVVDRSLPLCNSNRRFPVKYIVGTVLRSAATVTALSWTGSLLQDARFDHASSM